MCGSRRYRFVRSILPFLMMRICAPQQQYPPVNCPDVFQYSFDPIFGGYFGLVTVQRTDSPVSELQVNMTLNTGMPVNSNINISVLSTQNEIFFGNNIRYAVRFPVQEVLPKVTLIQFNNKILCKADADPLQPGIIQTSMWARSTITTYNQEIATTQKQSQTANNPQFFFTIGTPPSGVFELPKNPFISSDTAMSTSTRRTTTTPRTTTTTTTTTVGSIAASVDQCGITKNSHNLIIGGEGVGPGDFPWLVAIMYRQKSDYKFHCTGNLISDEHILTAGHCVRYHRAPLFDNEDLIIVLGKLNIENWASGGTIRNPRLIVSHPNYKQDTADYDIALIVMGERVRFRPTIRPICLWQNPDDLDEIIGRLGTIVGWNKSTVNEETSSLATKIEIPIVSQETCLRSHKVFNKYTSNRTFCAGNRDNVRGPCAGDSGAGFMIRDDSNKRWFLRGLVGFSIRNPETLTCDLSFYSVLIDIAKLRPWIEAEMAKN